MIRRVTLCAAVFSVWAAAQPGTTVGDVVSFVRAAVHIKQPDNQLAKSLHKMKLTERLDENVIEELQSEGAGPKAVTELERQRDLTEDLNAPETAVVFEHDPKPDVDEQNRVLATMKEQALDYSKSLPDFLCMQLIRRFQNSRGIWELQDTLQVKLAMLDRKEDYKLLSINGHGTTRSYMDLGGATSQGEFGSLLRAVFEKESNARFAWHHWTTLRGRIAHVFLFRIQPGHSAFRVDFKPTTGTLATALVGQHGYIYVDRETNAILRISAEADGYPKNFPVYKSGTLLDYAQSDVGGHSYLLPIRAQVRMDSNVMRTRNDVEFQQYRKFTAETTITFGQ